MSLSNVSAGGKLPQELAAGDDAVVDIDALRQCMLDRS